MIPIDMFSDEALAYLRELATQSRNGTQLFLIEILTELRALRASLEQGDHACDRRDERAEDTDHSEDEGDPA